MQNNYYIKWSFFLSLLEVIHSYNKNEWTNSMSVSRQWISHSCISCVVSQVKKTRKSNLQNSVFEDWPLLVRYQLEKTEVSMSRLCSLNWDKWQALTTVENGLSHIVTVCLCATPEITWKQLLRPERGWGYLKILHCSNDCTIYCKELGIVQLSHSTLFQERKWGLIKHTMY